MFLYFGVSNRGERALLAHDFAVQSLVCETFCDRGRFKGVVRWGNKRFELTAEQADFAALRDGKCWIRLREIRLFGRRWCSGMEKICDADF